VTGYFAGIDVGGTKCLAVVIDDDNNVVAESRIATPDGAEALVAMLGEVTNELASVAGGLDGVGFGLPGQLDFDGMMRFAPNLVDVGDLAIRERLSVKLGLPVFVDNNANCAATAELAMGAAKDALHAVLVTLGNGFGNSIIVDGEVMRGAHGLAGELGHSMVDPNGPLCPCGRIGCLERYASGSGLTRMAQEAAGSGKAPSLLNYTDGDVELIRGEHVMRGVRDGHEDAEAVLDRFGWWVGVGLANVVALLDPELIVLGGSLVSEWDVLSGPVGRHYSEMVLAGGRREPVRIEPAAMGERAGAVGAALASRGFSQG
jgi:glucokinase